MLLSKLIYLCIKNVIYQNDSSFTYKAFMDENNDFDNNIDLAMQVVNAFTPLNEAIARLSDLERIPYRYDEFSITEGNVIKLEDFEHPVKQIIGINQENYAVPFKLFGDKIYLSNFSYRSDLLVEYKEDIKAFDEDDLVKFGEDDYDDYGHLIKDNNIDLKDYGISEGMCQYIIEYVKGRLLEPIAPELANLHITTAETYFGNITPNVKATIQTRVQPVYKVEG